MTTAEHSDNSSNENEASIVTDAEKLQRISDLAAEWAKVSETIRPEYRVPMAETYREIAGTLRRILTEVQHD